MKYISLPCVSGSVVITTYSAVRIEHEELVAMNWFYVVLDEGHLIKNPDSDVTLACKSLLVCHWPAGQPTSRGH